MYPQERNHVWAPPCLDCVHCWIFLDPATKTTKNHKPGSPFLNRAQPPESRLLLTPGFQEVSAIYCLILSTHTSPTLSVQSLTSPTAHCPSYPSPCTGSLPPALHFLPQLLAVLLAYFGLLYWVLMSTILPTFIPLNLSLLGRRERTLEGKEGVDLFRFLPAD